MLHCQIVCAAEYVGAGVERSVAGQERADDSYFICHHTG